MIKLNKFKHRTWLNGRIIAINDDCRKLKRPKNSIILSDPPYNMNYHYNLYKDNLNIKEYFDLLISQFKDKCIIIHYPEQIFELSILKNEAPTKFISWVYNSNTPKQHRGIAFFNIKPNLSKVKQPCKNLNDKRILAKDEPICNIYDWWFLNQVKNVSKEKTDFHPCQIPIKIMINILLVGTNEDDIIFDPFAGSFTTAIACIRTKRRFIGCEIDSFYFNKACERIDEELKQGTLF